MDWNDYNWYLWHGGVDTRWIYALEIPAYEKEGWYPVPSLSGFPAPYWMVWRPVASVGGTR